MHIDVRYGIQVNVEAQLLHTQRHILDDIPHLLLRMSACVDKRRGDLNREMGGRTIAQQNFPHATEADKE